MNFTLVMNENERQRFERMCDSTEKMESVLHNIERALLGNATYREKGLIERFNNHVERFENHERTDDDKFEKIFHFQQKQKIWVGGIGVLARFIVAGLAVLGGWLISIFFG